ncbi:MAG: hypothetical protein ACT4O0_21390 [Pseudonocardia sp.]
MRGMIVSYAGQLEATPVVRADAAEPTGLVTGMGVSRVVEGSCGWCSTRA